MVRPQHIFNIGSLGKDHGFEVPCTCLEYIVDVHRFPYLVRSTLNAMKNRVGVGRAKLALTVEARDDKEMPERVILCAQIVHLNLLEILETSKKSGF